MTVKPAAGPETLRYEPLKRETIRPPIKPEYSGAPDASAIPRHKGRATKKQLNRMKYQFLYRTCNNQYVYSA